MLSHPYAVSFVVRANEFVFGEVMDYSPTTLYMPDNYYYPEFDTAFRAAPFNKPGVEVRLLIGVWNHTKCEVSCG